MNVTKKNSAIILITLSLVAIGCEKKATDELSEKSELVIKLDEDGNKVYSISGCDSIKIDSIQGAEYIYLTFSGCGHTFKDSIAYTPDWHYNCYPVYDNGGNYLYDDCYWEYY